MSGDDLDDSAIRLSVHALLGLVGAVMTALCLWLGHTTSTLAKTAERLTSVVEQQGRSIEKMSGSIDAMHSRVTEIAQEQAKRTASVYRVAELEKRLRHVEKAVK